MSAERHGEFCQIEPLWPMQSIALHLGIDSSAGRLLKGHDGVHLVTTVEPEPPEDYRPALTVSDSMGLLIVRELTRHYGGVEDTRSLRRDYDAERARVDKMLDRFLAKMI